MLNPAIEANQGLLLKEHSLKVGATGARAQPLLYVISSKGDGATHQLFPLGQWLGVNLTWSQVDLKRVYNGKAFTLREEELDTTAIGNYNLYHTTLIQDPAPTKALAQPAVVVDSTKFGKWELISYCTTDGSNGGPDLPRIPCYNNEPVNFIYTTDSFIGNHNDIFNDQVIAFMSTAVGKAIYERTGGSSYLEECLDPAQSKFSFSICFDHHFKTTTKTRLELEDNNKAAL
ncbi:hypothetical protein D9M70_469600 [compost metagenome]